MIEPGKNGRRSGSVAKGRCEAGCSAKNGRPLVRWILATLGDLRLSDNDLTGPIPPELTRLTNLRQLFVDNNSGLIGGIPQGFVDIELETVRWQGTQLCSPANEAFQTMDRSGCCSR